MLEYEFYYNKDGIFEAIMLICRNENEISIERVGNTLNMIEYIENTIIIPSKITFVAFEENQIAIVMSNLFRTKKLDLVLGYNSFVIEKKPSKIRGRYYDKMDSRSNKGNI